MVTGRRRLTLVLLYVAFIATQLNCLSAYPENSSHEKQESAIISSLVSAYPVPLSYSPNGQFVLTRTLDVRTVNQGLAAYSSSTGGLVASLSLDGDILRPVWSPNGHMIVAFLQLRDGRNRVPMIWDLQTRKCSAVGGPFSYAEPFVKWSPNNRYVLYKEASGPFVLIDISKLTSRALPWVRGNAFSWSPDSLSFAVVDPQIAAIRIFDLTGTEQTKVAVTNKPEGIAWIRNSRPLIVASTTAARRYLLMSYSIDSGIPAEQLFETEGRIGAVVPINKDRAIAFEVHTSASRRTIREFDLVSRRVSQLSEESGLNDIRSVSPKGDEISYVHSSAIPLYLVLFNTLTRRVVGKFHENAGVLPAVAARAVLIRNNHVSVPGLLWKSQGQASGAIIDFHGANASETYVWQNKIQLAVKRHFDYMALDYDDHNTTQRYAQEVMSATVTYAAKGDPQRPIVLLGDSAGAVFVVRGIAGIRGAKPVLIALVGLHLENVGASMVPVADNHIRVHLFECQYDYGSDSVGIAAVHRYLTRLGIPETRIADTGLKDTHLVVHEGSWVQMYAAIVDYLEFPNTSN